MPLESWGNGSANCTITQKAPITHSTGWKYILCICIFKATMLYHLSLFRSFIDFRPHESFDHMCILLHMARLVHRQKKKKNSGAPFFVSKTKKYFTASIIISLNWTKLTMKVLLLIACAAVGTQMMDAAPVGDFDPFSGDYMDSNPSAQYKQEASYKSFAYRPSFFKPASKANPQPSSASTKQNLPSSVNYFQLMSLPQHVRGLYEVMPYYQVPQYQLKSAY